MGLEKSGPQTVECASCKGTGQNVTSKTCSGCSGNGKVEVICRGSWVRNAKQLGTNCYACKSPMFEKTFTCNTCGRVIRHVGCISSNCSNYAPEETERCNYKTNTRCTTCNGTGKETSTSKCGPCNGQGTREIYQTCPKCLRK